MALTEKEIAVLKAFADNEYTAMDGEYSNPYIKHPQWMFTIQDYSGLCGKEFSGVVSSLTKKGFVGSDTTGDKSMIGVSIKDTWTMWMTDAGFDALQEVL